MAETNYWSSIATKRLSRRGLLQTSGMASAGLALAACGGGTKKQNQAATAITSSQKPASSGAQEDGVNTAQLLPVNAKAPKPGGTFGWYLTDTHRTNDPERNIGVSIWNIIGDRSVAVDPFDLSKVVPQLVEKWESPDPTSLILHLRANVYTHDKPPSSGRVLTAEDLAFNIARFGARLDPSKRVEYPRANQFDSIDMAQAVDANTVKLTLKEPDSTLIRSFADIRAQVAPKDFVEKVGFDDPAKAVGTGPFSISEYVLSDHETFKKFPKYWQTGKPNFDSLIGRAVSDRASAISAFINGQLNVFGGYLPSDETAIKGVRRDALFYKYPGPTWDHFRFNMTRPFFKDFRVRKAFQLAIDYKALGDAGDPGWRFTGSLHSSFPEAWKPEKIAQQPGYNPKTKQEDIANALKLLEAAGFPKGQGLNFKMTINLPQGRNYDNGVRIKDQFSKIFPQMGVELVTVPDYAAFTKLQVNKDFDMTCYNHTTVPDAVTELRTYYLTTGGRNYSGFSEPKADALLDKAKAATDNQQRTSILDEFQKRYLEEWLPLIDLFVPTQSYVYSANIGGVDKIAGTWSYEQYGSYYYQLYFTA
ncbi:MAG: ABC transporter substrate-binding protein [Dehalococcoidia bacterium]